MPLRDLMTKLQQKGLTVFALDCVPRISRAQSMDVLSSMSNIAGYRCLSLLCFLSLPPSHAVHLASTYRRCDLSSSS